MIRDPSDGSVREPKKSSENLLSKEKPESNQGSVIDPTISGLQTGSEKPENLARLEKSREWLRDYHTKKAAEKE